MPANFAAALDSLDWRPVDPPEDDSNLPHVTAEGVLTIGTARLRVYQLSDGQRVIEAVDLEAFFAAGDEPPPA